MLRKKLIILLNEYPYNFGEYSFIKTELEVLPKYYDVNIVSVSASTECRMPVNEQITLYHCIRKFGIKEKLEAVIKIIISKCGRDEIRKILKTRNQVLGRLYDTIAYYESAEQLRKFAKKHHLLEDDVIIYSYWFHVNCMAFLMDRKKYPKMKVISRIHGYDLYNERNPYNRQPFREYMDEQVDRIFFVADAGLKYYLKHWGKTIDVGKKYLVAPIGTVNRNAVGEFKTDRIRDYMHIVSCANVIPLKRIDLIIKALAMIDDITIKWTHFGIGDAFVQIQQQACELLSGKSNISYKFEGYVPIEDIMQFYEDECVDCFITTSSTEGCPVSIQEAMSFGVPIIATAVGEIPNMIQGNGVLLSENPFPEEVMDAIYRLNSSTIEEICEMRKCSRQLWECKYDALKNTADFINELRKL